MSSSLVVYQLKSMTTTNTSDNLREDHIMLAWKQRCMFPRMFHYFILLNTIAQEGYRASLFKTDQMANGRGSEINGELCKQSQQKL